MRVAIQKSRSVAEVVDPRVEKTRASIASAFTGLLMRRSYDRIRVSAITRKAAVGRATFYAHFATKDALLQGELVALYPTR
jgi:AcrR family transcriptional regulator